MRHLAIFRSSGWYRPSPPCSSSVSLPVTPRSAPPYCTYVGTSVARTSTTRTSGRLVARMSLRDFSGSSVTSMPAAFSSGRVSSKMRPLDSASVIIAPPAEPPRGRCAPPRGAASDSQRAGSFRSLDVGADAAQLRFHLVVAAVQVVDAVDDSLAFGHEARDHEACRGAQVGGHHRRTRQLLDAVDHRRVPVDLDARAQAQQFV